MASIHRQPSTMDRHRFTVCTACFNSSATIERVYRSLCRQTYKDFEWLVIDDASSDSTLEMLRSYQKIAEFDMRIVSLTKNRMVTWCYNLAVRIANGELLLHLDHDDELVDVALEVLNKRWVELPDDEKQEIAGMMSLCVDPAGEIVGDKFARSPYVDNFFDVTWLQRIKGEKFFCYKVDILRKHNFPLVDRYVPESVVLYGISDNFNTYLFNDALRIYHTPTKGGGNLSWRREFDYPAGFRHSYKTMLNRRLYKLIRVPRLLLSSLYWYVVLSRLCSISFNNCIGELNNPLLRFVSVAAYPVILVVSRFRHIPQQV